MLLCFLLCTLGRVQSCNEPLVPSVQTLAVSPWLIILHNVLQALDMVDEDRGCLVARSKCYLHLGNTALALQDAEDSLIESKDYHRGCYQKAEVLYSMGDFEHALMFYHRGHKIRPELNQFVLGIQKAQEAVNNSIGSELAWHILSLFHFRGTFSFSAPEACKLEKIGDLSFFQQQDNIVSSEVFTH